MPNNLTAVGRQAVLEALRGEVVKARLYGTYQYVVPGESPIVVAYTTDAKTISFAQPTSGATTSISMTQTEIEFDINIAGFNQEEEILIQGVLLTDDDGTLPGSIPDNVYLSAPFGQTFTYNSQGKFFLTDLNIFST